jgi:hypothetical protein
MRGIKKLTPNMNAPNARPMPDTKETQLKDGPKKKKFSSFLEDEKEYQIEADRMVHFKDYEPEKF